MTDTIYIYGLRETGRTEIRYVGQSANPRARHNGHINEKFLSVKNKKRLWIEDARDRCASIEYVILEECQSIEDAAIREQFWIDHYRQLGDRLTNTIHATKSNLGWGKNRAALREYSARIKEDWSDYIDLNDRW